MSPRRARGRSFPGARVPGILIVAGMTAACAAFTFCVIASVTYGWHRAITGPGIAVSFAAMVACVLAAHLLGDDQDGDQ